MNIFGIDLSLVPWPIFLLLIFIVVAVIWYLNVFLPLSDHYETLKAEEAATIQSLKNEFQNLITSVIEIKTTIGQHHLDNSEIIKSLDEIEKYANTLNDVSKFLNDKDKIIENKVEQINSRIDELYASTDEIKKTINKKNKLRL